MSPNSIPKPIIYIMFYSGIQSILVSIGEAFGFH